MSEWRDIQVTSYRQTLLPGQSARIDQTASKPLHLYIFNHMRGVFENIQDVSVYLNGHAKYLCFYPLRILAYAAGYPFEWQPGRLRCRRGCNFPGCYLVVCGCSGTRYNVKSLEGGNPLRKQGQAARLAVLTRFTVTLDPRLCLPVQNRSVHELCAAALFPQDRLR